MSYNDKLPIHAWAEDDRPREKFHVKGRKALSHAELIAILIGSGTRNQSAIDVGREVLKVTDNDIGKLSQLTFDILKKINGIGQARATTLLAAIELGRRVYHQPKISPSQIRSSHDAYVNLRPHLEDLDHEEFFVMLLSRANKVIKIKRISSGGISGTVVDARLILKPAIESQASGIILAHNHPSGQLKPSSADLSLTKKIQSAAKTMDMSILDHLIIGHREFVSFADEGWL